MYAVLQNCARRMRVYLSVCCDIKLSSLLY